jgi:Protein of unknown function (DUF3551)
VRAVLFVLGILVGAAAISTRAEAQNYPWCAHYGGKSGGGTNCGFTTFEQCLATVSGIGGFCDRNTLYQPPARSPSPRYRRRHRHYRHR